MQGQVMTWGKDKKVMLESVLIVLTSANELNLLQLHQFPVSAVLGQ